MAYKTIKKSRMPARGFFYRNILGGCFLKKIKKLKKKLKKTVDIFTKFVYLCPSF